MIQLKINGRTYMANEDETILDVARRNGIDIPTLCYHEGVESWGGCRLCLVEITKESWNGWTNLVTACLYPAQNELIVQTSSPDVLKFRAAVLDLLLARCPDSDVIRELAGEYGIESTSFSPREKKDNCILCGLCTRICDTLGASAIATVHRGRNKEIGAPFDEPPLDCVGCLSCAMNCPTDAISYDERNHKRKIWNREFDLISCPVCGVEHITREQADFLVSRNDLDPEEVVICDTCRRKAMADNFVNLFG